MNAERQNRVRIDWEDIAGEDLTVENIGGTLYAFGSELASLRLLAKYRHCAHADAKFSVTRKSWYFRLEGVEDATPVAGVPA